MRRKVSLKKGISLRFGWGTTIALIAAFGIILTGRWMHPSPSDSYSGPIVMEAGRDGKLHRVNAPSLLAPAPPKLVKWEVQDLLVNANRIGLTPPQITKLNGIDKRWLGEKNNMLGQIQADLTNAKPQGSESVPKLTSDLAGYSQLSERFNERRGYYLRMGLALLNPTQAEKWAKLQSDSQRVR